MLSSYIAETIVSATADAVMATAVESSATGWKRLLIKVRPDPKVLRGNSLWRDVKLSTKAAETICEYIESVRCRGILQILAYVTQADEGGGDVHKRNVAELEGAFETELKELLNQEEFPQTFVTALWQALADSIRLQVIGTRSDDSYILNKLLAISITNRKTEVPDTSLPPKGGKTARRRQLKIASIIPERVNLASNLQRSSEASLLVQKIRESFRTSYAHIIMPHARDDYRIRLEELYVERNMAMIDPADMKNLHVVSQSGSQDSSKTLPEHEIIDRRYVLIGNPGAGKSTFVRHLMYELCSAQPATIAPLLIELKTYQANKTKPFHQLIAERLQYMEQMDVESSTVADLLVLGYGLVVFDGLDEITSLASRRDAVHAIESFCRRFPLARTIVTSRPEGYSGATLDSTIFTAYRLPDFTDDQVDDYVNRWFALTYTPAELGTASPADSFLRDSAVHAHDLRTNPLMLSLLCMVYKYSGYIPENRPRIYEECSELLFERWDSVRHIRPEIEPDTKGRYLVQELAYYFFKHQGGQGGIEERLLLLVLQDYLRRNVISDVEVARRRARDFLNYCAGRAWIISMIGTSPRGDRIFAFTHRTFMEYFVACYLVRQNSNVKDFVHSLREYIKEGSSDVIPQIAIQRYEELAADGLDDCLSILLFDSTSVTSKVRSHYLPFVMRCVKSMHPSPRTMEKIFTAACQSYSSSHDESVFKGLNVSGTDYAPSLKHFILSALGDSSLSEEMSFAMKAGSIHLLLEQDPPFDDSLLSRIQRSLSSDGQELQRYKHSFPDGLTAMVRRRALSIDEFASACSAEQLIRTVRFSGAKTIRGQGALLQEMNSLFRRIQALTDTSAVVDADDEFDDDDEEIEADRREFNLTPLALSTLASAEEFGLGSMLSDLISFLFQSPGIVLPMRPGAMKVLSRAFSDANYQEKRCIYELMSGHPQFSCLMFAVLAGSTELYDSPGGSIISQLPVSPFDGRVFYSLAEHRRNQYPFDRGITLRLRRWHLNSEWFEYVRSWTEAKISVVVDEDNFE
jgi:NACHT domain